MHIREHHSVWRIMLATLIVWFADAASLKADLYQSCIRTVEWLVDNSDVIVVVRDSGDGKVEKPSVIRTLKGDAATIKGPLKDAPIGGYTYYGPPSDGTVRLVFIRGTSERLGAVKLGRKPLDAVKIRDIFYGVTEYGRLLLNESDLFKAIRIQLRARPSQPIARKKDSPHFERSGIEAPQTFPLEDTDDTFVLIVSFTAARRDHYINALRSGDAAERIHAIHELSQLIDQKAQRAIQEATMCENVEPTYYFTWSGEVVRALTTEDVRKKAKNALNSQ